MPAHTAETQSKLRLKRALNGIRRQAELILLLRSFQKLKDHAQHRQQLTHLKRCAVLLKHQDINRTVTTHFIRWLSKTQRQTSVRAGQRELAKIVVLPRNQDFVHIGIRYLMRWRLWLRRLRQRKCRNVILLLNKTKERVIYQAFHSWRCFLLTRQRERLERKVHELGEHNNRFSEQIVYLEDKARKHENIIDHLNNDAERLREQIEMQQQQVQQLHGVMEVVMEKLENPFSRKTNLQGHHAAEEAADRGDKKPLRLLNDCESVVAALERLRDTLPPEQQQLEGFEAVVEATCEGTKRICEERKVKEYEVDLLRSALYEAMSTFTGDPILSIAASGGVSKEDLTPSQSLELSDAACKAILERCQEAREAVTSLLRLLGTEASETHSIIKLVEPVTEKIQGLEVRMASQRQEVCQLRAAVEESLKLLTTPKLSFLTLDPSDGEERKQMLDVRHAADEAAQHGDDLPLRMISECESASKAMGKLGKYFLDNSEKQEGVTNLQTLVDAIAQEMDTLRAVAEESWKTLENPELSSPTSFGPGHMEERKQTSAALRAAEVAEQHGDGLPLRLLSNCVAAAKAFHKLRKILPENGERQEEGMCPEAIADAISRTTRTLREELLNGDRELEILRASEAEKGRLLKELQSHDERWEPLCKRDGGSEKGHFRKQFDGTEWKDVMQHKPAELQRSFIADAADACHVDPASISNIRMTAGVSSMVVEFDVQHDPSVSVEELARRINAFPFRAVRRMYDCRSAPKDGMDMLQEQLTQKEQQVQQLHGVMEVVMEKLENPFSRKTNLQGHHAAEEAADRGDKKPLRLLNDCESVVAALERLRDTLPPEQQQLEGFEAVVEAACIHADAMGISVSELNEELSGIRSLAVFFRDFIKEGAEKMMILSRHGNLSVAPSLVRTVEEIRQPSPNCDSKGTFSGMSLCPSSWKNSMELVGEQLSQEGRLDPDGPPTASVLRSFYEAFTQVYETLMRFVDLHADSQETIEKEREAASVLATAAGDAVQTLRSWPSGFKESPNIEQDKEKEKGGEMDSLADVLRLESVEVAHTLSQLRNLLSTEPLVLSKSSDSSLFDSHNEKLTVTEKPNIITYHDLVDTVKSLIDRLKEVGEAYENIYTEFKRYVPDLAPASGDHNNSSTTYSNSSNSRRVSFVEPPRGRKEDLVKKAESVVCAVRDHIKRKKAEVRALRGTMRKGIEVLGGSDDDLETDDDSEDERSAAKSLAKSAAIGSKLTSICQETGEAIHDAKTALGIPEGGKLKLSDMIPKIKEKMVELEYVKTESEVLVKEVRHVLAGDLSQQTVNLLRSLKPKRKPIALSQSVEDISCTTTKSIKSESTEVELSPTTQNTVKPGDLIKELRKEICKKGGEIVNLRDACGLIITLLDGTYTSDGAPPQYGEMLVPLLITQAEDLKRARRQIADVFPDDIHNTSVGTQLLSLASEVDSLRIGNTGLRDELDQRTKQSLHLVNDFMKESTQLREINADMQKRLDEMWEQSQSQEQMRRLWAERVVESMSLRMVKGDLRRWFLLWLGHVAVMRGTRVREATDVVRQLSLDIVRKQHHHNILATTLARTLHALPGEAHATYTSSMELICMANADGNVLETFLQKRLSAARAWVHTVTTALPIAIAALRADTVAIREALNTAWSGQLAVVYRQLLTEACVKLTATDAKDREMEFLRKRALDREAFARANKELAVELVSMKDQLALAEGHIVTQNDRIDKLQLENRDLYLNGVIYEGAHKGGNANNNMNSNNISGLLNDTSDRRCENVIAERDMIAEAKRLALDAIEVISGKDLAISIGEVAELTLDMYRRTTAALGDICNAQHNTSNTSFELIQLRLRELQTLHDVRNEIVARLPELLRIPYTG